MSRQTQKQHILALIEEVRQLEARICNPPTQDTLQQQSMSL